MYRLTAPVDHSRKKNGERVYFLCRCRFRSLRCLCLRIFLRRFLITLPKGFSPRSRCTSTTHSGGAWSGPRCRDSHPECQADWLCIGPATRPFAS